MLVKLECEIDKLIPLLSTDKRMDLRWGNLGSMSTPVKSVYNHLTKLTHSYWLGSDKWLKVVENHL